MQPINIEGWDWVFVGLSSFSLLGGCALHDQDVKPRKHNGFVSIIAFVLSFLLQYGMGTFN